MFCAEFVLESGPFLFWDCWSLVVWCFFLVSCLRESFRFLSFFSNNHEGSFVVGRGVGVCGGWNGEDCPFGSHQRASVW